MPWFWRGLKTRVPTLSPRLLAESAPGVTPGRPVDTSFAAGAPDPDVCPSDALAADAVGVRVALERCVHCMRCRTGPRHMTWLLDSDWAISAPDGALPPPFRHSVHVRVLDSGDCGGCLNEVRQLQSPVYSLHRFGVFVTPTPREADVLLVTGPVTKGMEAALWEAYAAMPTPKRVVAVGTCAATGGVFQGSFAVRDGAQSVVPVDVVVPGCPPPPLAILGALRAVLGEDATAPAVVGEGGAQA